VGARLRAVVRAPDTVARIGGDEFAILLERTANAGEVAVVTDRVVNTLAHPFGIGDVDEVQVSASIGVVADIEPGSAVLDVIDRADTALYRAKRTVREAGAA
jgi:diguanylate cyclase (GGDEF)-like protein